jgi:hypothetical protein
MHHVIAAWFHSKSEGDITCICLRWLSGLREWTISPCRTEHFLRCQHLHSCPKKKKIPQFYGTERFITVFTETRHVQLFGTHPASPKVHRIILPQCGIETLPTSYFQMFYRSKRRRIGNEFTSLHCDNFLQECDGDCFERFYSYRASTQFYCNEVR